MSKLNYKAFIEDIRNDKCTDAEIENLLDIFEYAVKHTATTLARKAWFELKDFSTAKQRGVEGFTLTLERKNIDGQEQWYGDFEYGSKNLKVIGSLERD